MHSACTPFLEIYRATLYHVTNPPYCLTIRLDGRRHPGLDRLLGRHGARRAVFITAWNPWSRAAGLAANRRAQARLRARLREAPGLRVLRGFGAWPEAPEKGEESLLALGLDAEAGAALGRAFRQNAVVVLRRGAPAALLCLR
ncbi:hypothetical protein CR162_19360 [Pseudoroseomonas rhizosphaerae]|uniref:DUF3293 domain-containing protein n=1 Tax=Teichococcus rhizosphaerae TaxID=1335062 RepID=A0A2C6ZZQ0_9PROT|nr:DUF3293 domain-containing protein [Pseudoroseomonas rhizosphaerae]PHK93278.1 hypothetical protein CR162_19360 [Pseudoroseomonas rhizosphaerae]